MYKKVKILFCQAKSLMANENYARSIHMVQTASYSTANPQKQIPDQEYSQHAHCNCTRSGMLLTLYTIGNTLNQEGDSMRNNKIAAFMRESRKAAGLTQEEFAMRSGLGLRFVRNLEQGKETVRLDKVNQALAVFGMEAVPGRKESRIEDEQP